MAESKVCTKCGAAKPLEAYNRHPQGRFGLRSQCRDCQNEVSRRCHRAARSANPDKLNRQARDRHAANPDKINQRARDRRANLSDKINQQARDRHAANPGVKNATNAKRRSAKLQRTPPWADLDSIKQFYVDRPEGEQVDHEIPLQGELVSGLHVLPNLQYLTGPKNLAKGNSFNPDDWYWTKDLTSQ